MAKKVALGIDIGGTNTAFGLVDEAGNIIKRSSIKTNPEENAEKLFERLNYKFNEIASPELEIQGIGIGAPNANYFTGFVELPPNLNWGVVNIVSIATKYWKVPTSITNDANAAAIGEMKFGAARNLKDFIMITLGTGVGSGIIANGNLIYGHDGYAGEIGHSIVIPNGRECGCGRLGCLETYASAEGIKRTVFELLSNSRTESELKNYNFRELNSKIIYDLAVKGDKLAIQAFEFTGDILGKALADAVVYVSPKAFVLFGGLANAGSLIFNPVKSSFEKNLLNVFKNKIKIIPSELPEGDAAILGAAALIWEELDKNKNFLLV